MVHITLPLLPRLHCLYREMGVKISSFPSGDGDDGYGIASDLNPAGSQGKSKGELYLPVIAV